MLDRTVARLANQPESRRATGATGRSERSSTADRTHRPARRTHPRISARRLKPNRHNSRHGDLTDPTASHSARMTSPLPPPADSGPDHHRLRRHRLPSPSLPPHRADAAGGPNHEMAPFTPPAWAIWSSAPASAARAMPWPRCFLSTKRQVIRQSGRGGASLSYSRRCLMPGSSSRLPYWHHPCAAPSSSRASAAWTRSVRTRSSLTARWLMPSGRTPGGNRCTSIRRRLRCCARRAPQRCPRWTRPAVGTPR
jgi:hypothetical protein